MANRHFRNILLYVLLQAVSRIHAMKTSLKVAVEGGRIEMECTTNSIFGVDWKFNNATKEYKLFIEGVIPYPFKMDYSVTNVNYSSYKISYLSIAGVKKSNVGTYICLNYENQQILTSVDLALLTIPICEPDTNSTETMRRFVCNFTSAGNISSRSEWIGDFCTNSTPTVCSDANEGNINCEFPINGKNRTFLPFATNLTSHVIEVCEIRCSNWEKTSTDGFQTTSFNMSIQISVLLQCSVAPSLTATIAITSTTPARPHETIIGPELYFYGSIAASVTGVLLTVVIISAFYRNRIITSMNKETSSAFPTSLSREAALPESEYAELQEDQMQIIINTNEETSSAYTGLSREAPLPGSDYAELQEDQIQSQSPVHANQDVEMATYMELIE